MMMSNQQLAEIIASVYYGVYGGEDDVESFIEWLENDCPDEDDEE